jgi:hypothetical protein
MNPHGMWLEYIQREENEAQYLSHGRAKGGLSGLRENTSWAPNGNSGVN